MNKRTHSFGNCILLVRFRISVFSSFYVLSFQTGYWQIEAGRIMMKRLDHFEKPTKDDPHLLFIALCNANEMKKLMLQLLNNAHL